MADTASQSSQLGEEEQAQVAAFQPLRATGIHEILRKEGESELERTLGALTATGLAAGLSMGLSFVVQALLHSGLPDAPWRHLVASLGYTVGFVVVVLGRQQLFTENTLTAVLPVLTRRDVKTLVATARLWAVVLASNIAGTWLFAAVIAFAHPFRPEVAASMTQLAAEAVPGAFAGTIVKAVLAGWLIALMVWLLPSARSAGLFVIVLLTWVVSLARFPHIIAGSTEAAYAVLTGARTIGAYWTGFFLPALIGNTIGGSCLVAMLNHAPVASELEGGGEE